MSSQLMTTRFTKLLGIKYPIIGGPMYPCSNAELIAAVSEAGGIGMIQPLSLTYVFGYPLDKGIDYIRTLTQKPIGMNLLIEQSSKTYHKRMEDFLEIALKKGIRFFNTALGNPKWVVDRVHAAGGLVFHDCTEKKWAEKALKQGVDGLICVNNRAGGHAGTQTPHSLLQELSSLNVPLVCAGGIGSKEEFREQLEKGYDAVQIGTRLIATTECKTGSDYKQAIVKASEKDIVLTERLTGVPVSIICTDQVKATGTKAGFLAKRLLRHPKFKHWVRTYYGLKSFYFLKRAVSKPLNYQQYWQAGKSVETIHTVEPVSKIFETWCS